jgi:integrase
MSKSSRKRRSGKPTGRPKKPDPDFPLSPHASGAWQKKIRGKIHYFGRWATYVDGKLQRLPGDEWWMPALELYQEQKDDLHAGRTPRVKRDGLTTADLCNAFLTAKHRKVGSGELSARAFMEYKEITDMLVAAFGKTRLVEDLAADDFENLRADMTERWGPVRLGNGITRVKSVFKYGFENGLMATPVRYGGEFKKPDKAVLRRHRAQNGERMMEAAEVRLLLDALAGKKVETDQTDEETGEPETVTLPPNPALRAMVLLGVNAGFGNGDSATLPLMALDLDDSWLDYPRPKTGIARRCWLWPETVAAIREALAERTEPRQDAATGLLFTTARGSPWIHHTATGGRIDNVTIQFTKLLKTVGLHRAGVGFYTLRHVFRTVADAARDPVAIDLIMGHTDPSMAAHYRERIDDDRLRAVAEHVRRWLFGGEAPEDDTADNPNNATPSPSDPPQPEEGDTPAQLRLFAG